MAPLLTLPGTAVTAARAHFGNIECGAVVAHEERLYYVLGFDPAGVSAPRVYLEDVETHLPRTAGLAELARAPRSAAAA